MESKEDIFELIYLSFIKKFNKFLIITGVIGLRFRKFLALPYCYFKFVNWNECKKTRMQVAIDFCYIFFKLKYYPENYGYCRLWEIDKKFWKYYYGSNYDAYQSYKLQKEVQRKEYRILFDDKEVSSQICEAMGINVPKIFDIIQPNDDIFERIKKIAIKNNLKKLIIKPTRGSGGYGVRLVIINDDGSICIKRNSDVVSISNLVIDQRYLLQEFIVQDNKLSRLTSAASIRISTLLTNKNNVLFLNSEINTAINNNIVSNWSAGGVSIGVRPEDGSLMDFGFDKNGKKYSEHPTTRIKFSEYVVPMWREISDLAIKTQKYFKYYKLLGLDITLSNRGPVLLEINATPDLAGSEQTSGPLLASDKIREEFINYDLLINNMFK
jgi:glutathione synthase/RimK-type ligase-like ATP-grasp enzyme